jgi:hypothetical protein
MIRYINSVILAFLITTQVFLPVAIPATLGYQIDVLLSGVRTAAGGLLAGGHVHFYAAGGTTPKTVWTDVNKNTAASNPYQLSANGTALLYGDGLYRIDIHTSTNVVAYSFDNIRYEDFGTTMTRLTTITGDNTGNISGFVNITGPGTGNISGFDNLTLTGNITGDNTGNISGFDNITNAGYGGTQRTGDLIVKNSPWVDVRAYGAATNNTGTQNATAVTAAIAALPSTGGVILFPPGVFSIDNITITKNKVHFAGLHDGYEYADRHSASELKFTGGTYGINLNPNSEVTYGSGQTRGFSISNMTLNGDNTANYGLNVSEWANIRNCQFTGFTTAAIRLGNFTNSVHIFQCSIVNNSGDGLRAYGPSSTIFTVEKTNFRGNGGNAIYIESGSNFVFRDCVIESNTGYGFRLAKQNSVVDGTGGGYLDGGQFINCWFENNMASGSPDTYANRIDSAYQQVHTNNINNVAFRHCTFTATAYTVSPLYIGASNDTIIEDCMFYNTNASNLLGVSTVAKRTRFRGANQDMVGLAGISAIVSDTGIGTVGLPRVVTGQNSWVCNASTSYPNVEYTRDELDFVSVQGVASEGVITDNTTIFTLPVGHRPLDGNNLFLAPAFDNTGLILDNTAKLYVQADGTFKIYKAPTGTYRILIPGVKFRAVR